MSVQRTKMVTLRLTQKEYERFRDAAKATNTSVSDLLRKGARRLVKRIESNLSEDGGEKDVK